MIPSFRSVFYDVLDDYSVLDKIMDRKSVDRKEISIKFSQFTKKVFESFLHE